MTVSKMTVEVNVNIQRSISGTLNIEGVLFEIDMSVQRELPVSLIR
jgi:F0F1-type ATP synthase delta subunit